MTVHNHGPEDGLGLMCAERRMPDGSLKGRCMGEPVVAVSDTDELIARLKGERGTALQAAQCYRAQRDLAWAEIDRLKEQLRG